MGTCSRHLGCELEIDKTARGSEVKVRNWLRSGFEEVAGAITKLQWSPRLAKGEELLHRARIGGFTTRYERLMLKEATGRIGECPLCKGSIPDREGFAHDHIGKVDLLCTTFQTWHPTVLDIQDSSLSS